MKRIAHSFSAENQSTRPLRIRAYQRQHNYITCHQTCRQGTSLSWPPFRRLRAVVLPLNWVALAAAALNLVARAVAAVPVLVLVLAPVLVLVLVLVRLVLPCLL